MPKIVLFWNLLLTALTSRSARDFYDRIAPIYDNVFTAHRIYAESMVEIVREEFAGREAETRALDVGCGTGMVAGMLAERGFAVIGLDFSHESLSRLQANFSSVITVNADAAEIPYQDKFFDAVVSLGAWRHFPNPEKVIAEVNRIISEDGLFIVGYFPPAIAGLIPLRKSLVGRLLISAYRMIMRIHGYCDRADFQLEAETVELAKEYFGKVESVTVDSHGRLIVARNPIAR